MITKELGVALSLMAFALSLCFLGGCVTKGRYKKDLALMFDIAYEMGTESCQKTQKQTKDYRKVEVVGEEK